MAKRRRPPAGQTESKTRGRRRKAPLVLDLPDAKAAEAVATYLAKTHGCAVVVTNEAGSVVCAADEWPGSRNNGPEARVKPPIAR